MCTILNELNLNLQGKQKLVIRLRDKVKAFKTTLKLQCCQISQGNLSNFPTLESMCRESELSNVQKEKFSSLLTDLSEKFEKYFPSFDALSVKFSVVSETGVCPVAGLTLDEAAAFLAGVRARRAADRR